MTVQSVYDISICRYTDIMSSICRDLTAGGFGEKISLLTRTHYAADKRSASPAHRTVSGGISPLHPITYATDRASCHGIVDPPLLFFALIPNDPSCGSQLRGAAVAKKRSRRKREKSPLERNRGILAPARREVALSLSLNRTIIHRKNGAKSASERNSCNRETEVSNVSSRLAPSYGGSLVSRLCLRLCLRLAAVLPRSSSAMPARWMLPKVVLIGEEPGRL